jgi:uncharacterized membrane protein HdeD (DUF308 family)
MLVVRGCIAFLAGVLVSNNSGMQADTLFLFLGVWTLADGAALVRQAYPSTGTIQRAEAQPGLMVLGGLGVLVGAITVVAPGVSTSALIWLLAMWFAVRAVAEGMNVATSERSKARIFMGMSALVDVGLVVVFATHTGNDIVNLALFGGAVAALWGGLQLGVGVAAAKDTREHVASRLLAPR